MVFGRLDGELDSEVGEWSERARFLPAVADSAAQEASSTMDGATSIEGEQVPSVSALHSCASWSLPCLGGGVAPSPLFLHACFQILSIIAAE